MNAARTHDITRLADVIDSLQHLADAGIRWDSVDELRRSARRGPLQRRKSNDSTRHECSPRQPGDQLTNSVELLPNSSSTASDVGGRQSRRLPEPDFRTLALTDELVSFLQRIEPAVERRRAVDEQQERIRRRQTRILAAQKKKEAWRKAKLTSPRMNDVKREELRVLWLQRPPQNQTENDVFPFFLSLWWTRPELLPRRKRGRDNQYYGLYPILRRLIRPNFALSQPKELVTVTPLRSPEVERELIRTLHVVHSIATRRAYPMSLRAKGAP